MTSLSSGEEPPQGSDGVLFTDGRSSVFLHPPEPYPGGGFHQRVDLVAGPFRGDIDTSSFEDADALRSFHRGLVTLYQTLKGEAALPNSYDNLKISLKGNGLGHFTVNVDAVADHVQGVCLSFRFAMDQTQLPDIISAIERLFLKQQSG